MIEPSSSHYIAFSAFIQLAVALNFGLVYLDKRSSILQLKRRLFSVYKAGNNSVVNKVANILKRYKSGTNYSRKIERYHTKTKEFHSIVTSEWDDEHEISFFPALGVVYGFYSLIILYLICFFEISGYELYYHNQFLVVSQLTLFFSLVLIVRSWKKDVKTKIIPTNMLYILILFGGWICSMNGWIYYVKMDFAIHYHWYVVLAFLPIIYYVIRIILIFLRKTYCLIPMAWWAALFRNALDER